MKHTDWKTLAKYDLSNENFEIPYENCSVYVPHDNITEFFSRIEGELYEYTVISADSDYSVVEQGLNKIEDDMPKWINMMLNGNMPRLGYNPLIVPPRCNLERCKITDRYSVKMYSYTQSTFPKIPSNVKIWFTTNCGLTDKRIRKIPFGVPNWSEPYLEWVERDTKIKDLYVNFQLNTMERLMLWRGLDWANRENVVSHEEYVERIKKFLFVLCPEGNGLDCYRTLEVLYCGSIPVMLRNKWNDLYNSLPVIFVDNWNQLSPQYLLSEYEKIKHRTLNYITDLDYWRDRVNASVS